jgi:ubiquinone/menaquinone biosynthesis C-methylase UbiE
MHDHRHGDHETDLRTKEAWEKNWEGISIERASEIFGYDRVKKQMAIMTRVLPKQGKILEGGCGLGPYLIRLRELGYDVEGIDYNEGPIRKLLEYDPKLPVKVGDVTAIPYPDGHFGGYLSLGVIEHFTEGPRAALREANRVLKKGGVLYLAVPRNHLFMRLATPARFLKSRPFLRKLFGKDEHNHYWEQYFKKEDLVRMLSEEGFDVREIHPLDHAHALVSSLPGFRDKKTYDEANALGLKLGAFCEKHLPWATAAQMALVCRKRD